MHSKAIENSLVNKRYQSYSVRKKTEIAAEKKGKIDK